MTGRSAPHSVLDIMRVACHLRQRAIVEPVEYVAKALGVGDPLGEMLTIGSAQRSIRVFPCLRAIVPSFSDGADRGRAVALSSSRIGCKANTVDGSASQSLKILQSAIARGDHPQLKTGGSDSICRAVQRLVTG
jgi:hypothetical protein